MSGQTAGHLDGKIANFNRVYGDDASLCHSSDQSNLESTLNLCKHREQSYENPRQSYLASSIKHCINAKQSKDW